MTATEMIPPTTSASFWDRLAKRYAKQPIADPASYEATLARTQSYLSQSDRVLEIGAGTSSTALRLAPGVAEYVSSDYAEGMAEIGREKAFDASIPGLRVVQGGLGDAALGQGPYDALLAFNLLHLLPDLHGALRAVGELVGEGGVFISKSPCLKGRVGLMRLLIAVLRLFGRAPYVAMFTAEELEGAIRAAGFEIIEAGSYPAAGRNRYIVARKL